MVNPFVPGRPDHYLFVIDTSEYAGEFERELCAYVTGQIGDCRQGNHMAERARQEAPELVAELERIVKHVPDEHRCFRPVSTFPNPRYGKSESSETELVTDANRAEFHRPVYFSVAIYFDSKPTPEQIETMQARARAICAEGIGTRSCEHTVAIEGFRLLEGKTVYEET